MLQDKYGLKELYSSVFEDIESLEHVGRSKKDGAPGPGSGRYPLGSGENPQQRSLDFLGRIEKEREANISFIDKDGTEYTGDTAIAKRMGITTTKLRTLIGLAKDEARSQQVATAKRLREEGLSTYKIGEKMEIAESTVRSLLNDKSELKMFQAKQIAEDLKKAVDEKGMIQVGSGVERELNISSEKMKQALYILELQGYNTFGGRIPQVQNPKQMTTIKVLCPPDTPYKVDENGKKTSSAIYDLTKINTIKDYICRDGVSLEKKFHYPESMDSSRLMIRYKEDGGIDRDGVMEIRRGVPDLDLRGSHYAQVRILVDNDRYLKGMAVYGDDKDFPPGVDVIFNTNKTKDVPTRKVLKEIKKDKDNPFGSAIKDVELGGQYWYDDPKTGKKKLGLINKRSDEGDWSDWSNKLPSQFLSKQSITLARKQLKLAIKEKTDEYKAITELTNPTVKKKLLEDFSDGCDSAAVHLHAAALPRQKYHVILPINSLKDTEIYAPNYKNGEQVALIRYPHGGTFEIPILTVNNKHKDARRLLGPDITDAVGINSRVAERLSGADFDGDTVMVIPTNDKVKITSTKELDGLKGFDPKVAYPLKEVPNPDYTGKKGEDKFIYYNSQGKRTKVMSNTQNEMGRISNLISDMTLQGARPSELARAVRHSMVVIDAEKHKLDYRQSALDNDIASLKKEYQPKGGASTLISRAKSEDNVPKRQGSPKINLKYDKEGRPNKEYDPSRPEGALLYKTSDDLYYPISSYNKSTKEKTLRTIEGKKIVYRVDDPKQREDYEPVMNTDPKTGKISFTNKANTLSYRYDYRKDTITKMAKTDDAFTLISDANTPMEREYASYANKMKALANEARKELATTGKIKYDKRSKEVYQDEVAALNRKLMKAEKNAPRERQAQIIANSIINSKLSDNPDMSKEEQKKLRQIELEKARQTVGAKRYNIEVTDREWEAIQAGAISETSLKKILNHADMDVIRQKATPKISLTLTPAKEARLEAMRSSGLTLQQIASALGVSTSTVSNYLRGKE